MMALMRPADTSPEAWKVYIDLQRKLTPAEKMRQTFEWSEFIRQASLAGLRRRFPNASEREIFLKYARMTLGEELFRKAYGKELAQDGASVERS